MNISGPFIRRPIATSLLAAAVLLAGAAAYTQLPVAPLPQVDLATISVSASLPGASPGVMASAVATPLERRFGRIAGLSEMTSSSLLGATSITMQFDLSRDVDSAARDVQAAVNAAGGDLPANLPSRPSFRKVNPADAPIMILSLTSDTLPLGQVFDVANTVLAHEIAKISGVGQVQVGGGQQPAVRVQVDPVALAGVGLGLEDVRNVLSQSTSNQPKGSLSGPLQSQALAANDQLLHADAYRSLILSYRDGAAVRLGEVADVTDDVENHRVAAWTDGKRAVLMIIRRQPGANIIEVVDQVKALLPTVSKTISPAIHVAVALDRSQTIRASVRDVERTLLLAIGLVVLVVFLFLRSGWATAIPTVAVPLSLVGTFAIMYLLGYTLDNLSLMALTISTGFVVDDAIVVTENVTRRIEAGETVAQAALNGAKQIGFTIVSITVSLLAVFIPLLLMDGVVGRLFREFAITLSVAIIISALVSLTLTPMMCSKLLRKQHAEGHGWFGRVSERALKGLIDAYGRSLRWVLRHSRLMLLVTAGTVGLTVYLYWIIPTGLFPQQDTGQLGGFSEAPQDISFPAIFKRQAALNKIVLADPAVAHMVSSVGGGFGSAGNTGNMFVSLKPLGERKASADEIIARLRPKLAQAQGIKLTLQSNQDVKIGGRSSRAQYQYTIQDPDAQELAVWAPRLLERLGKLKQLKDVTTDQQTAGLELDININRDEAARLGVPFGNIDGTLYDAFGQRQVATSYTELNQYRVVLEVKPEFQQQPDSLDRIYVSSATGSQVPLMNLAKVTESATPLSINHQGQFPAITMSFNLAPGVALSQAVTAIHDAELQMGMPGSISASFQGTAAAYKKSLASEPMLILAALLAVYIVLGVLYESLIHPLTILSTLPSAGVGALLALLLFHLELSLMALIGVILLIGIVKKNAILMIDFAIEAERDQGLSPEESIYQACVMRFRPIIMTTLAATLGALPLALGHGSGSELRRPIGIAIVGGLLMSQLLTLFTTPVVYLALDRLSARWRGRKRAHAAVPATPG